MRYCFGTFVILFVMLTISCKKSNPPQNYFANFSSSALEYVNLTEGKYLIYKDSATMLLDSVIVTTSQLQNISYPATTLNGFTAPAHTAQQFSLILSKFDGGSHTQWFNGSADALFNYPYVSTNSADVDLREPDNAPALYAAASSSGEYSIIIEGKTYSNVIVNAYDNGLEMNNPTFYKKTVYYWAKGVGLIKRTTITTSAVKTYTLLRNN